MSKKNINYKRIEGILHSYCTLKCEISKLEIDIEEMKDDVSIASTNFDAVDSGRCDSRGNNSKVESEVIKRERAIANLEREIRCKERMIRKVDNALSILNPEDKVFVQLRYFDKIPMNNLAERYNVEARTMYHRKDSIVKQISVLL